MRYRMRQDIIRSHKIGVNPPVEVETIPRWTVTVTDDNGLPILDQEWDHRPTPEEIRGRMVDGTLPLDDAPVTLSDVSQAIETLRADIRAGRTA